MAFFLTTLDGFLKECSRFVSEGVMWGRGVKDLSIGFKFFPFLGGEPLWEVWYKLEKDEDSSDDLKKLKEKIERMQEKADLFNIAVQITVDDNGTNVDVALIFTGEKLFSPPEYLLV